MLGRSRSKNTDEELIILVQQGDERALTELYSRYSPKLVRYFHRMLWKDEEKAQDFLHDLFVKVIETPARVDASRRFSTWIYSVAHNMCKNEYRRQQFRNKSVGEAPEVTTTYDVRDDIDDKTFRREVEHWMSQADEEDRGLFIMRYELELTITEIAGAIGIPEGTVKSRLFYLKRKLAGRLYLFNPALN